MTYSLPLLFVAALLPDVDFLFQPFVTHHSITHSATFWSLIYIPLAVFFRLRILPYAIATYSHFLIGDVITGNPPLLYGLSDQTFGTIRPWIDENLGWTFGVLYQALVDVIMIASFIVVTRSKNRDLRSDTLSSSNPLHLLILVIVIFAIFFGAYKSDLVLALHQIPQVQSDIDVLYIGYGVIVASHAIFTIWLLKGLRSREERKVPQNSN